MTIKLSVSGLSNKENRDIFAISLPDATNNKDSDDKQSKNLIKPTPKRYLILLLFCLITANKSFQWIQIPASTNKVTLYYDVSNYVINSTSVLFMAAFLVLSLPSCYIIELIGIRKAVLVSSFGASVGALIKCFCCQQASSDIYLLFIGQVIVSLSEQLIFSVPSRLTSVWFPDHQVSIAFAMTVLGNSIGVALGFMIPQFMLEDAHTKDQIGQQMYYIFLCTAIFSTALFIADWFFFDEAPKFAPGAARLIQIRKESEEKVLTQQQRTFKREMSTLLRQVTRLYTDHNYILLTCAYGINVGLGYTIHTILNQMLEPLWPGDDILVGNSGFIIIASGALGSVLFGHVLDKTHRYRLTNILLTLAAAISLLCFGIAISVLHSRLAIYLTSCFIGLFQIGLVVAGLELAVELTYPQPELLTTTMINVSPQIFGCVCIYAGSYIIDNHGAVWTNLFFISLFLLALLILCCLRETLNRQIAVASEKIVHNCTVSIVDNHKNDIMADKRTASIESLEGAPKSQPLQDIKSRE